MKKEVEFSVEGTILRGFFYIPEVSDPPPGVILFHGSGGKGSSLMPLAEKLMENGIFTFFFNFRGCGISDGDYSKMSIKDALKDARRAFDFMLEQKVDHARIGVVGSSFGGKIASAILPEYPVNSIVLKAPSADDFPESSLIQMGSEEEEHNYFFNHPERWKNAPEFKNISEFKGDLMIIKSGNDFIIPDTLIQNYYYSAINAKNRKIEVIKGADHRLSLDEWVMEFTNISLEWFLMTLK